MFTFHPTFPRRKSTVKLSSVQYSIPYDMLPLCQNDCETNAYKPVFYKKTSFMTKVFTTASTKAPAFKRSIPIAHHKKYDLLEDNELESTSSSTVSSTGSSSGYSSKRTHYFMLKSRRQRSDTLESVTSGSSFMSDSESARSGSTSSSRSSSPERSYHPKYAMESNGWVPARF